MKSCRLCLVISENTFDIFKTTSEISPKNIEECVNIKIDKDDFLPKQICCTCYDKIKQWILFRKQCHEVDSIFNKIKTDTILKERVTRVDLAEDDENLDLDDDEYESLELQKLLENPSENIVAHDVSSMDLVFIKETKEEINTEDLDSNSETGLSDNELASVNTYTCDICSQEFKVFFDYLDHQPTHDGEPVFKCDRCEKVFTSRESLVEHDINHGIICKFCGKSVLLKSLRNHLIMHTNKYSCSVCHKTFTSVTVRDQHYNSVHTNIKNHICETCGKKFSAIGNLRLHMRTHFDERQFACKKCPYAGRTASALYAHSFTHANNYSYICEICASNFKNPFHLNRHRREVHDKIKRYKCSYCHIEFFQKSRLTIHVRCHTGEKPYKCNECGKTFKRQDALKEHKQVHQKNAFKCDKCYKTFRYKRSVRRHVCILNSQEEIVSSNAS